MQVFITCSVRGYFDVYNVADEKPAESKQ